MHRLRATSHEIIRGGRLQRGAKKRGCTETYGGLALTRLRRWRAVCVLCVVSVFGVGRTAQDAGVSCCSGTKKGPQKLRPLLCVESFPHPVGFGPTRPWGRARGQALSARAGEAALLRRDLVGAAAERAGALDLVDLGVREAEDLAQDLLGVLAQKRRADHLGG